MVLHCLSELRKQGLERRGRARRQLLIAHQCHFRIVCILGRKVGDLDLALSLHDGLSMVHRLLYLPIDIDTQLEDGSRLTLALPRQNAVPAHIYAEESHCGALCAWEGEGGRLEVVWQELLAPRIAVQLGPVRHRWSSAPARLADAGLGGGG